MVIAVVLWSWRTLRAALACLGGVHRGGLSVVSSVVLVSALCLGPLSAALAPPMTLSWVLRRVFAGGVPRSKGARSAVASPAHVVDQVMNQVMGWLPRIEDDISATDILKSYGYPAEGHFVTTEDGYRLRMDRVVNPGRQPVFLAHGMQTGAPCYALLGKDKSISTMLFDAGYDVWLVNYRGTHLSQGHANYSVHDENYWKFSFHEHGVYDNPAAIDYVLQKTGFPSVLYASHSMGSTSLMIMASTRPEYQDKVLAAFLMAPAGPLHRNRSPLVALLHELNNVTQPLVETLNLRHTMRPFYMLMRRLAYMLHSVPMIRPLLYSMTFTIVGRNPKAAYYELPHFWSVIPTGGSWGEVFHYEQNADRKAQGFRQYDHGSKKNQQIYGSKVPPQYALSKIHLPVHFYLGQNDILCAEEDMEYLKSQLQNLVKIHYAPDPLFNHMDFFASPSADREIYMPMIQDMRRFSDQGNQPDRDNQIGREI